MNESEAFLHQARSDFHLFEELWKRDQSDFSVCHALQHLQMATEKMSKSALISMGEVRKESHVAFRILFQHLNNPVVARKLGYSHDPNQFRQFLIRHRDWFQEIERLSPSVGTNLADGGNNGPNVEYPWPSRNSADELVWIAPVNHRFQIASELRSLAGADFIKIIRLLLERLPSAVL